MVLVAVAGIIATVRTLNHAIDKREELDRVTAKLKTIHDMVASPKSYHCTNSELAACAVDGVADLADANRDRI